MATNPRDLTTDELHNLDDLNTPDVPEYTGGDAPASDGLYTRAGKAAPTEIFPRSKKKGTVEEVHIAANPATKQTGPLIPSAPARETAEPATEVTEPATTAFETAAVNREPEYIPPAEPAYVEPVETVEPAYVEETVEPVAVEEETRRGTTDLGLFLLRLFLGAYLIIDSVGVFFRLGGNEGISGLEDAYAGYPYGNGLAVVVPTLELAAGVFLVLGLLTPVAAAVAVAVTGFMALHAFTAAGSEYNVFAWSAETWVPVMLLAASLAVQFTGPGRYGIDASRGWAKRPLVSSWICALIGLAAAGLMWWFGAEINPF